MSGHTKEPWAFQYDHDYTLDEVNGYFVTGANGDEIFYADNDDRPETWGNLKRAAECVSALAGYNPAALAALVEAVERIATVDMGGGFLGAKACRDLASQALTAFRAGEAS